MKVNETRHRAVGSGRARQSEKFLTHDDVMRIFERCVSFVTIPGAEVSVSGHSDRTGVVQWARNRAFMNRDTYSSRISVYVNDRGRGGSIETTQFDDASLKQLIARVEERIRFNTHLASYETRSARIPQQPHLKPKLWSETTESFDGDHRGEAARQMIAPVEKDKLLAAGDLQIKSGGTFIVNTEGTNRYYPVTRINVSTTIRDAKGTGSGWAGIDDYDVTKIDFASLAQRALEKCKTAVNPVALEPGRYTAILEPQAVADLWNPLFINPYAMDRAENEAHYDTWPFGKQPDQSRITERVLDPRLSLRSDPMDPVGGFIPFSPWGDVFQDVRWIESGVLKDLAYGRGYAIARLGTEASRIKPRSWRLDTSGTATVEEMIATTKRGVLVTRLHQVRAFHEKSWSCTGYTRDGLWLIENGRITKPVKNFRFTESPLFAFNNVEQVGKPQRVFSNSWFGFGEAWVAPALKVRDFNFSQLSDAV